MHVTWQLSVSSRNRVLKTSLKKVGWYLQALSQSGLKFTSRIWGCMILFPVKGNTNIASYYKLYRITTVFKSDIIQSDWEKPSFMTQAGKREGGFSSVGLVWFFLERWRSVLPPLSRGKIIQQILHSLCQSNASLRMRIWSNLIGSPWCSYLAWQSKASSRKLLLLSCFSTKLPFLKLLDICLSSSSSLTPLHSSHSHLPLQLILKGNQVKFSLKTSVQFRINCIPCKEKQRIWFPVWCCNCKQGYKFLMHR